MMHAADVLRQHCPVGSPHTNDWGANTRARQHLRLLAGSGGESKLCPLAHVPPALFAGGCGIAKSNAYDTRARAHTKKVYKRARASIWCLSFSFRLRLRLRLRLQLRLQLRLRRCCDAGGL